MKTVDIIVAEIKRQAKGYDGPYIHEPDERHRDYDPRTVS
ncbi:hypothetical protein ABIF26_005520 [Bradyrhizobium elkanii]|jgi:hypothetical protein|uniref:Uncharacterized protein n=1 Tax=Bradyrhizobium elkanii TaxID=29448 RepID=A0A8I1Y8P4_BRAEL|nr:hypothetical protein [Bradyrhizobium elkanii]